LASDGRPGLPIPALGTPEFTNPSQERTSPMSTRAPDDLAVEIATGIEIDCQYVVHLHSAHPESLTHVCRAARRAGVLLGRRLRVSIAPPGTLREHSVSVVVVPDQVSAADNARLRGRAEMLADLLVELRRS
jgi:hypothetical protein